MAKVMIDLTVSLDGFIAGPGDGDEHPLGKRGGMHLFDWYTSGTKPFVHLAPYLLGDGVRLFGCFEAEGISLEKLEVVDGPHATHLHYRVMKK